MTVSGVLPALITPFDTDGRLQPALLPPYIERLKPHVDGLFVCGSYGSGPLMSVDERQRVAEVVADAVGDTLPWVLHAGAADEPSVLELINHATPLKPAAFAAVTPFYYRHTDAVIERFYKTLIDSTDIPVLAYNNPKYSNYSISPRLLNLLAEYGLGGIKDSSGDIGLFYTYLDTVRKDGFTFLVGSQTLLLPAVLMGGHGCVSGLSNAFPQLITEIYRTAKAGDYVKAAELQGRANHLRRLTGEGIPVPFYHTALPMLGIDIGMPKPPFVQVPAADVDRLRAELERLGLLN